MEKISAVEDFLTCPVCLETFKEPVSLGCHHSFCSVCLHNYWDQNSTRTCPVCRRKVSKDFLDVNFALKELTLSFTQKEQAPGGERPVVCSSHPEQTPLFCLDERRPLCPVCEFSLHSGHKVVSVDSAVSEVKEQLRSQQQSLSQRREQASHAHTQCEQIQELAHAQVELCERHIRAEFERLHRFLQQEEESVLRALRQEQSRQAQAIEAQLQQIREELCTMEQNLQTVEDLLQRQSVDFLTQYRHTHKDTQTLLSQHSPQLGPGLLINQAKVLANVAFNAWNKMRALVSYSPVTLDPNTAGSALHLSEDLRGVRRGETEQQVPENPERFCKYADVLGSEGFSSGSHQWDVEVGDHPYWAIGLAKESVDRKGDICVDIENGFWCLGFIDGEYIDVVGKILSLKRRPQRIRVRLDCDEGEVFFFDAGDMSLICSHKHRFTEKMFPYFYVGESGDAKTKEIKIFSSEAH